MSHTVWVILYDRFIQAPSPVERSRRSNSKPGLNPFIYRSSTEPSPITIKPKSHVDRVFTPEVPFSPDISTNAPKREPSARQKLRDVYQKNTLCSTNQETVEANSSSDELEDDECHNFATIETTSQSAIIEPCREESGKPGLEKSDSLKKPSVTILLDESRTPSKTSRKRKIDESSSSISEVLAAMDAIKLDQNETMAQELSELRGFMSDLEVLSATVRSRMDELIEKTCKKRSKPEFKAPPTQQSVRLQANSCSPMSSFLHTPLR